MSFFNQQDLNSYIAGIQPKLGTDKLVTFSEYKSYLDQGSVKYGLNYVSNELSNTTGSFNPSNPSRTIKDAATIYNTFSANAQQETFIRQLVPHVCGEDIEKFYGKASIKVSMGPGDLELLLRVPGNYNTDDTANKFKYSNVQYATEKISKIKAFIVVQKGECQKYMNAYTVKLICGQGKGDAMPLMGAYCYMIAKNNERTGSSDKGILELAGLYANISGLCSYTKFGFVEDLDLLDDNCYINFIGCLPMSANISRYQPQVYIDIVNSNRGVSTHAVCQIKNELSQEACFQLYNILFILNGLKKMMNTHEILYNPTSKIYMYSNKGSAPKQLFSNGEDMVINFLLNKHGITPDELVNSTRPDSVDSQFNEICAIFQKYINKKNKEAQRDSSQQVMSVKNTTVDTPALSPSSSFKNGGYKKRSRKGYKKGSSRKGSSRKSYKNKSRRN